LLVRSVELRGEQRLYTKRSNHLLLKYYEQLFCGLNYSYDITTGTPRLLQGQMRYITRAFMRGLHTELILARLANQSTRLQY